MNALRRLLQGINSLSYYQKDNTTKLLDIIKVKNINKIGKKKYKLRFASNKFNCTIARNTKLKRHYPSVAHSWVIAPRGPSPISELKSAYALLTTQDFEHWISQRSFLLLLKKDRTYICLYHIVLTISSNQKARQGAQLVRANVRMCGRGTQSWVQFFMLVECTRLPSAGCGRHDQRILRFMSPGRVQRAHPKVWGWMHPKVWSPWRVQKLKKKKAAAIG